MRELPAGSPYLDHLAALQGVSWNGDPQGSSSALRLGRQGQYLPGKEPVRVGADHISIGSVDERPVASDPRKVVRLQNPAGYVPQCVLIVLMTSALVVAVWGVASDKLVQIVQSALSNVCGNVGC